MSSARLLILAIAAGWFFPVADVWCRAAEDAGCADLLRGWRQRMVEHLSVRGEHWVQHGDLVVQEKPLMHGPSFPRNRRKIR